MHISFSQINSFLECPHKYKLLVIDQVKFTKSIELVFGTLIHQSLHFFYSQDQLPSLDELLRFYQGHWPQKDEYGFSNDETEAIYFAEGAALLSNFYRDNYNTKPKIVDLESRFEITLVDRSGETHILTGVIDRVDNLGEGLYEIIDYKTNKIVAKKEAVEENLQLDIYHLALSQRYPKIKAEDIKLSLYFLRARDKITTIRNSEDPQKTKENILSIIEEIKTSDFQPTTTRFCRYLPYKLTCPMWKHLYKKEKTPEDQEIDGIIAEFFNLRDDKTNINKRINEIKEIISKYMEREKIGKVFSEAGYFSKTIRKIFDYDLPRLELELKEHDLWDQVLSFDEKKLEELLETLPYELKNKIINSKILNREVISLRSIKVRVKE